MPSPVGHILAGAAVYLAGTSKENRSNIGLGVTLAGSILPDFDFLPGILIGEPAAFHHGISHSFSFALLFGGLVFIALTWGVRNNIAKQAALLGGLGYASHLLLDLVSIPAGGKKIQILWPLFGAQFGLNLGVFGHFHHGGLEQGIWSVVRWDNVPAVARELIVLGSPFLLILTWSEIREHNKVARWKTNESQYER